MRTTRTLAFGAWLAVVGIATWGHLTRRSRRPLLTGHRRPLSERLGMMDDHLAEWR